MTIKKNLAVFSLIFGLALGLFFGASPALASGLKTSTDSTSGQVETTTQDEATFLTTNIANQGVDETLFTLPVGFARNLGIWITGVASLLIAIIVLLVFFQLIMGGFSWITSGGDKGKTDEARNRLVAAIIGLLIIAASYAVLVVLLRFIGFESVSDAFNNIRPISSNPSVLR